MRRFLVAPVWVCGIAGCLAAIQLVHDKKWPSGSDMYPEAVRAAKAVKPYLNADSVLNMQSTALPDDFFLYLRYCLIPQRAQLTPRPVPPAGKELLIAPKAKLDSLLALRSTTWPFKKVLLRYEDVSTAYCLIQH